MLNDFAMEVPAELESAVATTRAKVRFGYPRWLRPFLFTNVEAITLGRRVFVSPGVEVHALPRLLRHELVHVRQFAELGIVRFVWRYVTEYVRLRRSGLSASQAYVSISFEREALAAEEGETV